MTGYARKQRWNGVANVRQLDNESLGLLVIPAGRECVIFSAFANVDTVATTATVIELVEQTDSDTVWATGDIKTSGVGRIQFQQIIGVTGSETATTYPFVIPAKETAGVQVDRTMEVILNGDVGAAGRFGFQIDYELSGSL